MQVGGRDKVYVAIDAAIEVVLACAGIQLCVPAIVQTDGNDVISRNQCIGDVDRKSGVATLVVADLLSIDEDLGILKGSFELERSTTASVEAIYPEVPSIPAVADVKL